MIAAALLAGLSFVNNFASAIILNDYNNYSPEELIINDIIGSAFGFFMIISVPMFIIGVYKDSKNKKNKKKFSMILFVGAFFSYFIASFTVLMMASIIFIGRIYDFYPYFAYVVIGMFLFFIIIFAKISAKILNASFLVILSLFLIITSMIIFKSIT